MIDLINYRNAFIAAITLHVLIAIMLLIESTNTRPVLVAAKQTQASQQQSTVIEEEKAIKAVSVSSEEVMKTVNHLKEERLHQQQAEENRQKALDQKAEAARKARVAEQQRLDKLKNEAAKLAIAREKQLAEEQQRLKQLAAEKAAQEKSLADMKKQNEQLQKKQQQETAKLAELQKRAELQKKTELQKKKEAELAQAEQVKAAKAKDDLAQKQKLASQQAALNAEKNARMAGEVDKYKALIINAISRQWILPENANSNLSSQFRIRLAPNGVVLEVSLTRSSGDPILDRSAQSAIYKASPLPVPSDPDTFNLFRDISLTVRPESAKG